MTRRLMLAAGMAALIAPLLALPAAAQNDRRGGGPPAMTGRDTMLRAGPETGYPQVRRIEQGQQVQLFGCLADRSWCDVGYGNDRGWVNGSDLYADYDGRRDIVPNLYGNLQLGDRNFRIGEYWDENYRDEPFYDERTRWQQRYFDEYQPSWGPRPSQPYWGGGGGGGYGDGDRGRDRGGGGGATGYMLRFAYLRAGPDAGYPRVGTVRARARVIIYGCLRDWSWCDISDRRNRGWVFGQHISSVYRGRQRSVNSVAPYIGIPVLNFSFGRYWDDNYRSQPFYGERDRWERQYVQTYRPTWGNGPERRYQNQRWVPEQQRMRARGQLQQQRQDQAEAYGRMPPGQQKNQIRGSAIPARAFSDPIRGETPCCTASS